MSADVDGVVAGTGDFPDIDIALTDTLTSATFTGSLGSAHNFLIKDATGSVAVAGDTTKGGTFTFDWTPSAAGVYTYYCAPHAGNMKGKITVTAPAPSILVLNRALLTRSWAHCNTLTRPSSSRWLLPEASPKGASLVPLLTLRRLSTTPWCKPLACPCA